MASPMENGGSIVSCRGSFGRLLGLRLLYKAFRRPKIRGKERKRTRSSRSHSLSVFMIYYCRPSAAAMTILHGKIAAKVLRVHCCSNSLRPPSQPLPAFSTTSVVYRGGLFLLAQDASHVYCIAKVVVLLRQSCIRLGST